MPDQRPDPDMADPKGLIREAFRIDGITASECRSIFVDWALSVQADDPRALIERPAGAPFRRAGRPPDAGRSRRRASGAAAHTPPGWPGCAGSRKLTSSYTG